MSHQHVILVTYGEPPTASFIEQLVYSWRILLGLTRTVAPIPRPVIPVIALSRGFGRRSLWRAHRYGSPLETITHQQAARLRDALASGASDAGWRVHVAYEFRRPLLADVVSTIPADEPLWVAPMYAADSSFTHALSREAVAAGVARSPRRAPTRVLPALDLELLADLSAGHLLRELGDGGAGRDTALVLAAHGTLLEPSRPIDTGRCATERLYGAIRTRLSSRFGLIMNGWLNHTRGGRWTEPPVDETLQRVREAGYTRVVYFPYGFLADNAESQLEARLALAGHPALRARVVPCLNASRELAAAIAGQILGDIIPTRDAPAAAHSLSGMRLHHTRS